MVELVRHRQTKEPETDRPDLNHRATSRLYLTHWNVQNGLIVILTLRVRKFVTRSVTPTMGWHEVRL
jgi:hypothetical protein